MTTATAKPPTAPPDPARSADLDAALARLPFVPRCLAGCGTWQRGGEMLSGFCSECIREGRPVLLLRPRRVIV